MIEFERHPGFKKAYKKRILRHPKLVLQVAQRLRWFAEDPENPLLKDHSLVGNKQGLRAFSVTGDIRIVYRTLTSDHVLLLDIGSHNQVY